jgi:hypothetical protein
VPDTPPAEDAAFGRCPVANRVIARIEHLPTQADVQDLDARAERVLLLRRGRAEHDFAGLEVAMHQATVTNMLQAERRQEHDAHDFHGRQRPALVEQHVQRLALQVLHDEIIQAAGATKSGSVWGTIRNLPSSSKTIVASGTYVD